MTVSYSSSFSLLVLRGYVRDKGRWKTNTVPDSQIDDEVNSGLTMAYSIIVGEDESRQHTQDTSITTVVDQEAYNLPASCAAVRGVSVAYANSPTGYLELDRVGFTDRNRHYDPASAGDKESTLYAIQDSKLYLFPPPGYADTILIDYTRNRPRLVADGDLWDGLGVDGWVEFTVNHATYMCALRVDDPHKHWKEARDEYAIVLAKNARRDRARPRTRVDVNHGHRLSGVSSRRWWG